MSIPSLSLAGKVAIVTGGSRGIGEAIAIAFAEAGADVAICSRHIEECNAVAEIIKKFGRRSIAIQADVSQKSDVNNLVQKIADEFGFIDILVNNASVIKHEVPFLELSEEDWNTIMDINLKGYFFCSQEVGRRMAVRKQGNIINIASINAMMVKKSAGAPYQVSKASEVMLTKVLALELAEYNIRVNSIAPGPVITKLNEDVLRDPTYLKEIAAMVPLRRWADVSDIVGAALFLASDASKYITGQTIIVDGGITLGF